MIKYQHFFLAIMLLVAVLLVGYLVMNKPNMNADSVYYLIPAFNWLEGRGLTFQGQPETLFPPGYGFITYPAYVLLGDIEYAGMAVSGLAYVLLVGLMYITSRYIYQDTPAALLAAFFVLTSPILLRQAYHPMSDVVFVFLYLLIFLLYLHILLEGQTWARVVGLGALLGLLGLVRPEGMQAALLAQLGLWGWALWRGYQSRRFEASRWGQLAGMTAVFALIVLPYVFFLHTHLGEWTFSGKTRVNFVYGAAVRADPEKYAQMNYLEFALDQRGELARRYLSNWRDMLLGFVGINRHAYALLGITWVGYVLALRRVLPAFGWQSRSYKVAAALALFFSPVVVYPLFFLDYRFFLAYSPLLLLPVAYLITHMWNALPIRRGVWVLAALASLLFLVYAFIPVFEEASLDFVLTEEPWLDGSREAGLWLHQNTPTMQGATLTGPGKPNVISFFANGKREPLNAWYFLPADAPLTEIEAEYLVVEYNYRALNAAVWQVWDNPPLAADYGLRLLHQEALFQVYVPIETGQ